MKAAIHILTVKLPVKNKKGGAGLCGVRASTIEDAFVPVLLVEC